jgi:hypothetical protein
VTQQHLSIPSPFCKPAGLSPSRRAQLVDEITEMLPEIDEDDCSSPCHQGGCDGCARALAVRILDLIERDLA